jgi:hypothetical protein
MKTTRFPHLTSKRILATLLGLMILAVSAGLAVAQDGDSGERARQRQELRDPAQEPAGDQLRDRVRERIQSEPGLQEQERQRLRQHLGECDELGLGNATVEALFGDDRPLRAQLQQQERVLTMAREGLPVEPVVDKLREGHRKGVSDEALERVCDRMEEHVRVAQRVMEGAHGDGVEHGDNRTERQLTRSVAMNMWRGLEEGDMEQLRERARLRLRDHACTTTDLTAAAETATQLREMGVERRRAMELAGEALQRGYTAREVRQISWMVMAAQVHGGRRDDVLGRLEHGLRSHEGMSDMIQNMWQRGWMGPADEHGGRGGHSPVDDVIGGPGQHGGDHGGPGGDGGTGGDGGSGPGDDGHHGGMGG